ncbi:ZN638 protein, partial [Psilopogon haemacephalus]|nr:ZN638 protein [Psilopogon haemacephalus]
SSGMKKYPEGSGVVQTAAANPPVELSVAKKGPVPISHVKDELSAAQTEPSKSHLEGAVRESAARPAETSPKKVDAGAGALVASLRSADSESSEVKSEGMLLLPPSSLKREEAVGEKAELEPCESALGSASEKEVKKEDEELDASTTEPPGELFAAGKAEDVLPDGAVKLAVGESAGTIAEVLPPHPDAALAQMLSLGVTQPSSKWHAPDMSLLPGAVKTEQEMAVMPTMESKTGVASEKKLDVTGDFIHAAGRAAEENSANLLDVPGTETEKQFEKLVAAENAASAVGEDNEGSLSKALQSEGAGPPKADEASKAVVFNSSLSVKESCTVDKTFLKAVVSLLDISKVGIPGQRNESSLFKGGDQKSPQRAESQGQAALEKKTAWREEDPTRPGSSPWKASRSFMFDGRGGNWRTSSQQDCRVESRASSKQSQEGESRAPSMRRDAGGNKAFAGDNMRASKIGASGGVRQKEEEELFPFNLDEFVTVDEVAEETESPIRTRRNPLRGKRKAGAKANTAVPGSKRRKGKKSAAHAAQNKLSYVTLDEIGEEEDMAAQLMEVAHLEALGDSQGLLVVDEVMEEEELSEAVKDAQSLLTLDEIPEQEDLSLQKDLPRTVYEEQDLKAEPLVTVDEIGEVEELPLNEPAGLSIKVVLKQKPEDKVAAEDAGDGATSLVPDDPSALVTVDEIEDNEDNPLVTLDEDNEDEDDFLEDFNRLKEELNFVTVDEVGEEDEEEENTSPGKNQNEGGDKDIAPVAGPEEEVVAPIAGPEEAEFAAVAGLEETKILGDVSLEEELMEVSKPEGLGDLGGLFQPCSSLLPNLKYFSAKLLLTLELRMLAGKSRSLPGGLSFLPLPSHQAPLGRAWPHPLDLCPGAAYSKLCSVPSDLDYLVPKAGFFCQICSLFYADETSVKNHCKTQLHQQNMEKFMAKQDEDTSGEEQSSR